MRSVLTGAPFILLELSLIHICAKARNNRKRLTEMIQNKNKEAKSLPWAKTVKKGKTPKGQVKAVGAKGKTLGSVSYTHLIVPGFAALLARIIEMAS